MRILTPLATICLIEPHATSWAIFSLRDHANVSLLRVSPLRGVWPTSRIIVAPGDWQLSRFPGTTAPLGNTSWTFPYQMMLVLFLGKGNWSSPRVTNVTIMPTMSASPAIHSSSVCLLLFLLVRFPILHLPLGRSGTPLGACCCCMDWLEK